MPKKENKMSIPYLCAKRMEGGSKPIPTPSIRLNTVVKTPTASVMPASVAPKEHPTCSCDVRATAERGVRKQESASYPPF